MRPSAVWTSLLLMLAILGAACSRSSDAETDLPSLPSPASTQPTTTVTEPVTADVPGTATPSNAELEPDVAAAAESTCQAFTGARFGDRRAALEAARSDVGFTVETAMADLCPDVFERFETLEALAFNSASVNQNTTVTATCRASDVIVHFFNNNVFTIDAGVLVQVGSSELGATGGAVVLTLAIEPGETRVLTVDPTEVGTAAAATGCGADATAWEARTGPTATIFGTEDPVTDPGGRPLPQTRTNDPVIFITELIDFEVGLFVDPNGAMIEEFEDVRSPNFLRLIAEFDDRAASGERLEFDGSEISDIEIIDRPRDDLVLVGWSSGPGTVTSFDSEGNEVGVNEFGTRIRRGIFLRSPEDERWRWVHSAFTVLGDTGTPIQDDDAVTARGTGPDH